MGFVATALDMFLIEKTSEYYISRLSWNYLDMLINIASFTWLAKPHLCYVDLKKLLMPSTYINEDGPCITTMVYVFFDFIFVNTNLWEVLLLFVFLS